MNDGGVCRTAPTTPDLSYIYVVVDHNGLKLVSKGGKGREDQNLAMSRGAEKCINYDKFEITTKLRIFKILSK